MKNYGIINVATAAPNDIKIGNPKENVKNIYNIIKEVMTSGNNTQILVFPELSITGYTCGDLFNQTCLIENAMEELVKLANMTKDIKNCPIIFVGCPVRKDNQLFNCAVVIQSGKILGIIPKTFMPNYNEFYEMRHFSSATLRLNDYIEIEDEKIPFTPNLLIKDKNSGAVIGADICEDAWVPIPPSRYHCLYGANIIVNLSASNETIGKSEYRRNMLKMHSATCICGYIYTSASRDESTSDTVFSGHQLIIENGYITAESKFLEDKEITYGTIDIEKCINDRTKSTSFMGDVEKKEYITVNTKTNIPDEFKLTKPVAIQPFVPENINERSLEILNIQSAGLAQRLKKINCKNVVIGISGGLDSTLALIVALQAFELNNYDKKGIIGITMPCFGTSSRTLNNSKALMTALNITQYEINIANACNQHFQDINHDKSLLDTTFENGQARERTQVLMDMANKHNAIVVGTGDLSELALGWCTYNGDHMSMYAVNTSIPKTLVRHLVRTYAELKATKEVTNILIDICNTPISPELLPPKEDGTISQNTEDAIGSYVTHDFILYYMLRYGFSPSKIYELYIQSLEFNGNKVDKKKIINDMRTFYKRFQNQQFKRNCLPDGIKVGSVSVSPRADWRMPSDASLALWIEEIDKIDNAL